MRDLIIAYVCMALISTSVATAAAYRVYPKRGETLVLLITLALLSTFGYLTKIAGQLFLAHVVSVSSAIVWTNLAPVFAAFAAGWVLRLPRVPKLRRVCLSVSLGCGATAALCWPSLGPLLRPPPPGATNAQDAFVRQSDWATCSPAAAATLLRIEGVDTNEAELIPLCLTDKSGTPSLGLYRGLKLMALRHGRDVQLVQADLNWLLQPKNLPALLTVELPNYGVEDPRYENEWGWIPGMGHSVVALAVAPVGLVIGDPAVGIEVWTPQDLEILWQGQALRLTKAE